MFSSATCLLFPRTKSWISRKLVIHEKNIFDYCYHLLQTEKKKIVDESQENNTHKLQGLKTRLRVRKSWLFLAPRRYMILWQGNKRISLIMKYNFRRKQRRNHGEREREMFVACRIEWSSRLTRITSDVDPRWL
jgi:hypothetical protein